MSSQILAIIIPAFKAKFFRSCLQSIALQTCKNFNLYIGNDNSPEDLDSIIEPFRNKLNITYKRFEKNMGGKSLVKQWERCISLSENEEFIWMFSDDDLMHPKAVEMFYQKISIKKDANVYRFNLSLINFEGNIFSQNKEIEKETGLEFLIRRLKDETNSAIVEFIFSRAAYQKNNGFIEFPFAWGSDTASMVQFAEDKPITSIPGTVVYWRTGNSINISSSNAFNKQKYDAQMKFLEWISQHFPKEFTHKHFRTLVKNYIIFLCIHMFKGSLNRSETQKIHQFLRLKYGRIVGSIQFISIQLHNKLYFPYRFLRCKVISLLR